MWVGGNSAATARRAGRHADGWIPWQITPAEFALRAALTRTAYDERGHDEAIALALVAPLAAGRVDDPAAVQREIEAWRAAGATAFHVGFAHRSADDLVALLERFARDVMALQR
jgi:phthiodiolone/phenolphthiodiolone dimycocerosates ketoreductase